MFEFLFFITAVYLGYVAKEAYQAVARAEKGEPVFVEKPKPAEPPPKVAAKPAEAPKKPAPAAKVEAPKPVAAKPAAPMKVAAPKKAPAPTPAKTATPKPAVKPAAKPAAKPKATKASEGKVVLAEDLKNPETGEVTPVPANYRFAKKWIKDALVEEKLLDRVYKPNELDDATSAKVKDAIDKLRSLKKYQA